MTMFKDNLLPALSSADEFDHARLSAAEVKAIARSRREAEAKYEFEVRELARGTYSPGL
jgi:hypothetical protein